MFWGIASKRRDVILTGHGGMVVAQMNVYG
jgi:hypothetical protein